MQNSIDHYYYTDKIVELLNKFNMQDSNTDEIVKVLNLLIQYIER
jgi:hypothetical protein